MAGQRGRPRNKSSASTDERNSSTRSARLQRKGYKSLNENHMALSQPPQIFQARSKEKKKQQDSAESEDNVNDLQTPESDRRAKSKTIKATKTKSVPKKSQSKAKSKDKSVPVRDEGNAVSDNVFTEVDTPESSDKGKSKPKKASQTKSVKSKAGSKRKSSKQTILPDDESESASPGSQQKSKKSQELSETKNSTRLARNQRTRHKSLNENHMAFHSSQQPQKSQPKARSKESKKKQDSAESEENINEVDTLESRNKAKSKPKKASQTKRVKSKAGSKRKSSKQTISSDDKQSDDESESASVQKRSKKSQELSVGDNSSARESAGVSRKSVKKQKSVKPKKAGASSSSDSPRDTARQSSERGPSVEEEEASDTETEAPTEPKNKKSAKAKQKKAPVKSVAKKAKRSSGATETEEVQEAAKSKKKRSGKTKTQTPAVTSEREDAGERSTGVRKSRGSSHGSSSAPGEDGTPLPVSGKPLKSRSKVTVETYRAHVSPSKKKRRKRKTDGEQRPPSPKRKKTAEPEYQREVKVPESVYKNWKPPSEESIDYFMTIVDSYMKSLLNKASNKNYDMILTLFSTLGHGLSEAFAKIVVPEEKPNTSNNDIESMEQYLKSLIDDQSEVDKAIKEVEEDLDQLEDELDKKERSALPDRPLVENMTFPNLQRLLGVNSAEEVRLVCTRVSKRQTLKVGNMAAAEKNQELISKLLSIYDSNSD